MSHTSFTNAVIGLYNIKYWLYFFAALSIRVVKKNTQLMIES